MGAFMTTVMIKWVKELNGDGIALLVFNALTLTDLGLNDVGDDDDVGSNVGVGGDDP